MTGLPPIKDRIEMAAAITFAAYLATQGLVLTDLRPGDASRGEPDILATLAKERRGIEVVDVWYSMADARATMQLVRALEQSGERGRAAGEGFEHEYYEHPSGDPFIGAIQAALDSHADKTYAEPTWLILNAAGVRAGLHEASAGPRLVAAVRKPERFHYIDAYLHLSDQRAVHVFRVP